MKADAVVIEDAPFLLVVHQHLQRADHLGNPMKPFWDRLTVKGDDLKRAIRSGVYGVGLKGGAAGGVVGGKTSGWSESVRWNGDKLVITREERTKEKGTRESVEQHTEVWSLDATGQLVITVTDKKDNDEATTREVTYRKWTGRAGRTACA